MQPTATTFFNFLVFPCFNEFASSTASIESFFAASTKPQVLISATSASSALATNSQPSLAKRAASSSESVSLREQPKVTKATFFMSSAL